MLHDMGFVPYLLHLEQSHRPSCGCPWNCRFDAEHTEFEFVATLAAAPGPERLLAARTLCCVFRGGLGRGAVPHECRTVTVSAVTASVEHRDPRVLRARPFNQYFDAMLMLPEYMGED